MTTMKCEICCGPAQCVCSGLDVPMLFFCLEHGRAHELTCPDVIAGRSSMNLPERFSSSNDSELLALRRVVAMRDQEAGR